MKSSIIFLVAILSLFASMSVANFDLFSAETLDAIHQKGYESEFFVNSRFGGNNNDVSPLNEVGNQKVFGIDYASRVSLPQLQCLKNAGNEYIIPRGYRSVGRVDDMLVPNVRDAQLANFRFIDTYIFPCPKCDSTAAKQIGDLVDEIRTNNLPINMIWLDIEAPQYWKSIEENRIFFASMLHETVRHSDMKFGIYASKSQWNLILGADFTLGHTFPLWYPHYDNDDQMDTFKPFGGFTKPFMKQHKNTHTVCNAVIDGNFYYL